MNNFKKLRLDKGLSQIEIAEKLNCTNDYVSQIERGRNPGMKFALKASEFFNKTIDEIFFENQSNKIFDNEN